MYNGTRAEIIVSQEQPDPEYVYFDLPDHVRVHKQTGEIQLFWREKCWKVMPKHQCISPKTQRKLTPYYRIARITKEGTRSWMVSKIVATACVPNPNHYIHVNHKDGNSLNDAPDNLEWVDELKGYWNNRTNSVLTMEQRKELAKYKGDHRHNNPEFMRIYNNMRDSNGLTHAERFKKQYEAAGYVYRKDPKTKKYGWRAPDGSFHTSSELRAKFK